MLPKNETLNIAKGLIRSKNYAEAENVLLEAIRIDDKNLIFAGTLADLYIKMDRIDDAETYVSIILKKEPGNVYALQKRGDILAKKGRYNDALELFMDIYKHGDDSYFLLKRIIRIYYLMNDFARSLEFAEKAGNKFPDRADIFYNIFQICNKIGETNKAKSAIERAVEIEPDNKFYYSQKLAFRMEEKKLDSSEIEEMLEVAEENDPHLLKLLAERLKKEEKYNEAIVAYKRLMAVEDSEFNQKMLAYLYYKIKDYSKAYKIFISMPDSFFLDNFFLSAVIASAKVQEQKMQLIERMTGLAKNSAQYKKLWGRIKKLHKELQTKTE